MKWKTIIMDLTRFTEKKTGELIKIDGLLVSSHAFIPKPLPISLQFPESTWRLLADAQGAIGALNGVGKYLPNPDLLLKPIQRREAQLSSELEGTITNPQQQLLFDFIQPRQSKDKSDQDILEVENYRRALVFFRDIQETYPLSLKLIQMLHEILLKGVRGHDKEPGQFRRIPVQIGRPARFIPPPPHLFKEHLYLLEKYIHQEKTIPPLIDAFLVHYQFETIHPFRDGNGRVGRILLANMIAQSQQMTPCWLYMSSYFNEHKNEYLDRLFNVSADGQWDEWIEFCLNGVIEQAKDTLNRLDKLVNLSKNFKERITTIAGSHRLHTIIDELFITPIVQTSRLAKRFDIRYPTAQKDIDKLVDSGILIMLSNTRPKTYINVDVFKIIFEDSLDAQT